MTWTDRLFFFTAWDYAALTLLFVAWIGIGFVIENPGKRGSVSHLTAEYRRVWMEQMVTRDPRIFDSQILGILRQGTAFFASACMIAIGGMLALIGNAERLAGVAQDLTLDTAPIIVWELKLLVVILLAVNGFLKFVWSHRLFGYCAVLMAAVPNDPQDPLAMPRAAKAGEINVTAARGYNRGLRSVYFGIAAAAWLLGGAALILAALFTALVILRREFASESRRVLLDSSDDMFDTHT